MILANSKRPTTVRLSGKATLQAAAGEGQSGKIDILAYTGGELPVNGFPFPVVVDVKGLSIPSQVRPILIDHDDSESGVLGQTTAIAANAVTGELVASGIALGVSDRAQRVKAMAAAGYEWQASIGAFIEQQELIAAGSTVEVNGKRFVGPLIVARKATLREISFVPTGADDSTVARIAASAASEGGFMPTFEEWLASLGFDPATISEVQKQKMLELYNAKSAAPVAVATPPAAPAAPAAAPAADVALTAAVKDIRAGLAAEYRRNNLIATKLNGHADLQAKAIEQGWDENKIELELLRASRPTAPAGYVPVTNVTPKVLHAGLARACGLKVDKQFDDQTLSTADKLYGGSIGIKGFLIEAAAAGGHYCNLARFNGRDAHRAVLKAAFSTADVANILSDVQGKSLLEGWKSGEMAWEEIAKIGTATDFKQMEIMRLTSAGVMEEVGQNGELSVGSLSEDTYANKLKTYGELIAITRQMQFNDDLQALDDIPRMLGRKFILTLNSVFWTKWFAKQSTLFPTNNSRLNYLSGAGSALSIAGLTAAVTAFGKQIDSEKNPLGIDPAKLLCPPELIVLAEEIYTSVTTNTGGSSTKDQVANGNVHGKKYKPVKSAYLSNSTFNAGASSTAWFLVADPADLAIMHVAFLNGQRNPTVETAEADFGTLGIQTRAYGDFGCAEHEYRAANKSVGA